MIIMIINLVNIISILYKNLKEKNIRVFFIYFKIRKNINNQLLSKIN